VYLKGNVLIVAKVYSRIDGIKKLTLRRQKSKVIPVTGHGVP
jgi:hypothetical protein